MNILYRSEQKISQRVYESKITDEILERNFIMSFFKDLPLEELKRLVNFEKIDPKDKKMWDNIDYFRRLSELRERDLFEYNCSIYLDNGK